MSTYIATAKTYTSHVSPHICTALRQAADRVSLWTILVGVVVTATRPVELQAIEAAVKDQGGVSVLRA